MPFSVYWHQPQAEHEDWGISSSYLCIGCSEYWRKGYFWKISQTSEKKHSQSMSHHLLPDCYSFPFRPYGIPWTFLLFERLKPKVHTQPLVTGLREDLLHLWATSHRGNSVSVKCSKSSLTVQTSIQACWRIIPGPFCLVFLGLTSRKHRAEKNQSIQLYLSGNIQLLWLYPVLSCVSVLEFLQSKWVSLSHWFIWDCNDLPL